MSASTALHFVVLERVQAQRGLVAGAALAVLGLGLMPAAQAQVPVSPSGNTGNTIAQANTSDNVAVGPDGTIYVTYHGSNGVRVARSTDNGQSFGAPVTVTASDFEAEIAVSSNGTVYVAWVDDTAGNSLMLAKSTDEAQTFGSPIDTGFSLSDNGGIPNPTVHFSADGDHLYFVGQTGQKVIVSSDGGSTFEKRSISQPSDRVFSDVLVDPTTRDVIAQFDDPNVTLAVSTDLGASFGNPKTPNPQPSVNFSVGAISTSDQGRFLLIAGSGSSLERVNLDTNNGTSTSIPASDASQGRSLAADGLGNVVTGYVESGGRTRANSGDVNTRYVRSGGATKATKASTGDVKFKVSTDAGNSFGTTATTVASASAAQADINRTNGDVMFIYENSGDILMRTFSDQLDGYGLTVSRSTIDFGDVPKGTSSGTESVTVTNETGGDVSISSIGTTSPFSVSNDNCPSTLGDTESCVVDVVFSPSSTGSFAEELEIATDQPNSPRTVGLQGKGAILDLAITDGSSSGLDFSESVSPGTDDNPVGIFELSAGQAGASLDGVTVTNKNPGVAGISAARLYWSSDQTLEPGTDTQLDAVSTDASSAPSSISFSGFSQSIPTSARYAILAIFVQPDATADVQFELAQDSDLQTSGGEIATVNGNSQSSFSALPLSNGAVALPVELTSFEATASRDGARLTWQTASETGSAGFEVQRKSTGGPSSAWKQIGYVESKASGGSATEPLSYEYVATGLPVGTHLFRLRQVDLDGSSAIYGPVDTRIRMEEPVKLTAPAPSPASESATIFFSVKEKVETTIRLYNALGQRVATLYDGPPRAGERQSVEVEASGLPSGMYFLRLQAGGKTETRRLTVVR